MSTRALGPRRRRPRRLVSEKRHEGARPLGVVAAGFSPPHPLRLAGCAPVTRPPWVCRAPWLRASQPTLPPAPTLPLLAMHTRRADCPDLALAAGCRRSRGDGR